MRVVMDVNKRKQVILKPSCLQIQTKMVAGINIFLIFLICKILLQGPDIFPNCPLLFTYNS